MKAGRDMSVFKLINRLISPCLSVSSKCPRCGEKIKTKLSKPFGPGVVDGPTMMESKCSKCGYKISVPVRTGP